MKKLETVISEKTKFSLEFFENFTSGSGGILSRETDDTLNDEDINKLVQKEISKVVKQDRIIFRYWVSQVEKMTDNREIYGHSNQTSEKVLSVSGKIYVRGTVHSLAELVIQKKLLSDYSQASLLNLISIDLGLDVNFLSPQDLKIQIVMIPGDNVRNTFFKKFESEDRIMA